MTHEELRVPGAIELASDTPDFTWEIGESWRADRFLLTVTNGGASTADFEFTWKRTGIGA